jgi:hypothetical protein
VIGRPGELLDLERAPEDLTDTADRSDGFSDYLFAYSITWDYC